ncbi:hypothetical protein LV75_002233 [Actinokineospora diospyrosa]|uniref:Uncharacterized protein n=1 Tax=Actinokineospora diospyrosa TaxID=103728 RepID=A0ABT1IAU8_9PSEU|nr:hypothetical protein [Actinokineospora diospyrosa]
MVAARLDWRLVPGALVVWLAGLVGLLGHWALAVVIGGVGVVGGFVHLRHGPRVGAVLGAGWPLVVCGVLAVCPVAWRVREAAVDPLRGEAARAAVVEMRVEVAERPRG